MPTDGSQWSSRVAAKVPWQNLPDLLAETAASLAILTAMLIQTVVDQMIDKRISGLLVMCRSKNYSWPTAKTIICIRHERTTADIELARNEYYALSVEAAARVLRFIGARRALMRDSIEKEPAAIPHFHFN